MIHSNIYLKIFDSQVMPISLYGCEIWGVRENNVLEKVHLLACKQLLRIGQQTPNERELDVYSVVFGPYCL